MNNVFIIIFLASFVALTLGLIKPSIFSKIHIHTRKSSSLLFGALIILSFVIIGGTAPTQTSQSNQKQTLQPVITHTSKPTIKPTLIPTVIIKPPPTSIPPTTASYNSTQTVPSATTSNTNGSGLSNNNYYQNVSGNEVHSPAYSTHGQVPAGATAQYNDGTYSFSQHHSGTCSGHGGVAKWL